MSQPTSYRMNGLAESGSFLREGSSDRIASSRGVIPVRGAVGGPGGPQSSSGASLSEAVVRSAYSGAVATSSSAASVRAAERLTRPAAPLGRPALSPALRGGSVAPYAVRNNLRTPRLDSTLLGLQRWLGITLTAVAWMVFLWGMAHLVIAAVHNAGGELGASIDATVRGAKCCLGAFLLALAGVPQWLVSQRKLDSARLLRN